MIKDREEEVVDFKEPETKLMGKVVDLTIQCKIKDGRMNLLVKEVITLEGAILVTLGMKIMEKGKKYLGLRVLVTNVEKKLTKLLNVLTLERKLEVIEEIIWLVKELMKHLMNLRRVRT